MAESEFIITDADKEFLVRETARAENLVKALPHYADVFDEIKRMREVTDVNTGVETTLGTMYKGGKGVKVIARMPEAVLTWLMILEPNLLKDKRTFRKFMRDHPEYAGYTGARF